MIDNLTADFLRERNIDSKIKEKQTLQETKWSEAFELSESAEKIEKDLKLAKEEHATNIRSIALWRQQIQDLQTKISQAKERQKIIEAMDGNEATGVINQSIQCVDEARDLGNEIAALRTSKTSIDYRLKLAKTKYDKMKNNLPF